MKNIKFLLLILFFNSYGANRFQPFKSDLSKGVPAKEIEDLQDYIEHFSRHLEIQDKVINDAINSIPEKFKEKINLLADASKKKSATEFTSLYNTTFRELFLLWFKSDPDIWKQILKNTAQEAIVPALMGLIFPVIFIIVPPLLPALLADVYRTYKKYPDYVDIGKNILEKIDSDFAKYRVSYSKQQIKDYLNAASKDMFLFEVQTPIGSKESGGTLKKEVGNLKNINLPTQKEIDELKAKLENKEVSQKEFQDWVEKNTKLTAKLIIFNRWMKALGDLSEFLVKSGSKDLPPLFSEVLALNDDILDKIYNLKSASERSGTVIREGSRSFIKLDMGQVINDLKDKLSKIQKKIDSVYVFRQGPKDAKELLQILVGVPGKKNGIFDRVIEKMETDFGTMGR